MERPWGDTYQMRTREQNKLACRVLLLLRLCVAFQVYWLLEQPMSSLLWEFPKFKKASKKLGANMVTCWMHSYVAATAKGAKLLGNVPYLQKLKTTATATFDGIKGVRETTKKKIREDGSTSVSGGPDLKGTQSYPVMFGVTIASEHDKLLADPSIQYPLPDDTESDSDESISCIADVLEAYKP